MAKAIFPITGYALPYTTAIAPPPLLSRGGNATLSIISQNRLTPAAQDAYSGLVTPFGLLASSGAFSGPGLNPIDSLNFEWIPLGVSGNLIEWSFANCHFDERAATLLFQMFQLVHPQHPLKSISLIPNGQSSPAPLIFDPLVQEPYPTLALPLPFRYSIDADLYDAYTIRVQLDRVPTSDEESEVSAFILMWAAMLGMGLYGVAPAPLQNCTAIVDENVIFIDDRLEYSVSRLRAHPDSIFGLLNLLSCVHQTLIPIHEVIVE